MIKRKIKIEDLRRFKFVTDPQVSPDGERIALVLSTINYDDDRYERHIWMADRLSGGVHQFTSGPGRENYPRWSPDGKWLLFLSRGRQPEKKAQLWIIPTSGGEARLVAETDLGVRNPIWASDSDRILFLSQVWMEGKPESDVKVIKRLRYHANGEGYLDGRRPHIFTTNLDGETKQVSGGEYDVEAATWSPSGKYIGFVTNMNEDADISRVKDIFIIPSEGGEPRKVTEGTHAVTNVTWSPDVEKIAFVGHDRPRESFYANNDIWVIPVKGGEAVSLTADFDRSLGQRTGSDVKGSTPDHGAVWGPEGKCIYFLAASIPYTNVYKVGVDGGEVVQVTRNKTVDGFSISSDGRVMVYNAMDATHLLEVWVNDEDGERRITGFNDELLGELKLSSPEHFTFKNSLGEEIDGWVMKPPDYEEGKRYPTALEVHGGPRGSSYGEAFFHEFQVLASGGYVVIYTNPRGSSGYGEDYVKALYGRYYTVDFEDLMDFVDSTIEQYPFIDPEKLGILGGSYGGQIVNWSISHTDRFKAAVSFRCVCNWISKYGCADNGRWQPKNIAGDPDYIGNMELHVAKSPLRHAKNVKTPTLVVHSLNDFRSPLCEGQQWFTALKLQGVPTELVLFPDEHHGLSRDGKPRHREERFRHMLRWFDKYL